MNKTSRIYVAGHSGLVGSAIVRELERRGYTVGPKESGGDLRNSEHLELDWEFKESEYIFMCAAHAGGIKEAISNPADMLADNMLMIGNVLKYAHEYGVKKLINFASSCIYPVDGPQPYKEKQIGTGRTDENWAYAIAKIAGVELCHSYYRQYGSNFISVVPCNVYGLNDNFDPETSHVIPALIRKFHEAKEKKETYVNIWGSGEAMREFIYSDDLAAITVSLMEHVEYDDIDGVINVGVGGDITIYKLALLIASVVYPGAVILRDFDAPNGVLRKLMDISKMKQWGYKAETPLLEGIKKVYDDYCSHN
ncbi:GDP-L-fucose synthase [Candidatus Pacearchaeota archaeon]|nr:GDP-L-fucose synthase [Candidatus Pacearchaeota archaeon]